MTRRRWTKESISTEYLRYRDTGKPLQAKKFRKDNGSLYGAILYHFKSYKDFVNGLGIDYNELREKGLSHFIDDFDIILLNINATATQSEAM